MTADRGHGRRAVQALVRWLPVLLLVLLAACAASGNPVVGQPDASGQVAGFWRGLWHGCIAPITFFVSLFSDTVGVYEVHNNGGWYDFGFLMGLSAFTGGSGRGSASVRRRRKDQ